MLEAMIELDEQSRLAGVLDPRDHELLTLVRLAGATHRAAAMVLRLSPGTVSRRLARLRRRSTHPVVRALVHDASTLDPLTRELAAAHFARGCSVASLARQNHLAPAHVRARLDFVRGWARARSNHPRTKEV
jgi:hypothetical protein